MKLTRGFWGGTTWTILLWPKLIPILNDSVLAPRGSMKLHPSTSFLESTLTSCPRKWKTWWETLRKLTKLLSWSTKSTCSEWSQERFSLSETSSNRENSLMVPFLKNILLRLSTLPSRGKCKKLRRLLSSLLNFAVITNKENVLTTPS